MRQIESKKEMVAFFEGNLEKGHSAEELYSILLNQGYSKMMINAGYNEATSNIRKKKELQTQKDSPPPQKIEIVEGPGSGTKKSFFGKLFGRK